MGGRREGGREREGGRKGEEEGWEGGREKTGMKERIMSKGK